MCNESAQNVDPGHGGVFALGCQPCVEGPVTRFVQTVQQNPVELKRHIFQLGSRDDRILGLKVVAYGVDIRFDIAGVQCNAFAVGDNSRPVRAVDHLPQLAQRPAQRRLRVIGHVPEQFAQALPAMRAAGCDQKSQQRTRLARGRQREVHFPRRNAQFAKERDPEPIVHEISQSIQYTTHADGREPIIYLATHKTIILCVGFRRSW